MSCRLLVLADDMTGALEVGALFAGRGLSARVTTESNLNWEMANDNVPIHVIDTETRHLPPEEAFRIVHMIASAARDQRIQYIYKKTDSTLRGSIGSELAALATALPDAPLFYFPAYPVLGRTVHGGKLYVRGIPVSETPFFADELNPVHESHIPTLLQAARPGIAAWSIHAYALHEPLSPAVYVVDATIDEHLRAAARELIESGRLHLVAGPAGIARHLADFLNLPRSAARLAPRIESCLVVNGSRHEASAVQMEMVTQLGWPSAVSAPDSPVQSGWTIFRNPPLSTLTGLEYAKRLGEAVHSLSKRVCFDAIFAIGGDTVHGILEAFSVKCLWPMHEVVPGVPIAGFEAFGMADGYQAKLPFSFLITKAGGYGAPDLLARVRERISER